MPSFGGSGGVSLVAGFGSALAIISSRRARAALAFSILSGVRGVGAAFSNFTGIPPDHFGIAASVAAANSAQLWAMRAFLSSAVISAFATMPHRLSFRA